MQCPLFNRDAPKKAVNLSINSELLKMAKASGINLSQTLELRLTELLREEKGRQWLQENHDAINEYNTRVEANGVFSDDLRRF